MCRAQLSMKLPHGCMSWMREKSRCGQVERQDTDADVREILELPLN